MAGAFGSAALAAHTAVNQLDYIVFQVAVGLSHAASINVSRELALDPSEAALRIKPHQAHRAGLDTLGIWLGVLTGLATTAILLLRRYSAALTTHYAAPKTAAAT